MDRRSKRQGRIDKDGPVKITTYLPSKRDEDTSYSLEGLHKHRIPV
jgi:hypothetical protein